MVPLISLDFDIKVQSHSKIFNAVKMAPPGPEENDDSVVIVAEVNPRKNAELLTLSDDEDKEKDVENNNCDKIIVEKVKPKAKSRMVPILVEDEKEVITHSASVKRGYIKEYIQNDGLGLIHSDDVGLVLFHVDSKCLCVRLIFKNN